MNPPAVLELKETNLSGEELPPWRGHIRKLELSGDCQHWVSPLPSKGITPVTPGVDGRAPTLSPGLAQLQPQPPGSAPQHIRPLGRRGPRRPTSPFPSARTHSGLPGGAGPGWARQAAFTNQLYAARVETSQSPRGPRSPPVRPAGPSPAPAPRPPPDPRPRWLPAEACGPEPRNLALPATEAPTPLPTFGALFNSRINSLRRRRKDPRGTRRCPESCPAGVAQGPMGIRSSACPSRQHFLQLQDHISQKDMRERLKR